MDMPTYVALSRQSGLLKELQVTANNVANMATTGYRAEGLTFAEMVEALPTDGGSVAMTAAQVRHTSFLQGELARTGGTFDLAIQGQGFFQIETPEGVRLTRAGAFLSDVNNELVTAGGNRVLDLGGAPIFIPPDAATITVAEDGTIGADGAPIAQIGVVTVDDLSSLTREGGSFFIPNGEVLPVETPSVFQGYIEQSNVNPIEAIARLVEVQRAYEIGQKFLESEDERVRSVIRTIGTTN